MGLFLHGIARVWVLAMARAFSQRSLVGARSRILSAQSALWWPRWGESTEEHFTGRDRHLTTLCVIACRRPENEHLLDTAAERFRGLPHRPRCDVVKVPHGAVVRWCARSGGKSEQGEHDKGEDGEPHSAPGVSAWILIHRDIPVGEGLSGKVTKGTWQSACTGDSSYRPCCQPSCGRCNRARSCDFSAPPFG